MDAARRGLIAEATDFVLQREDGRKVWSADRSFAPGGDAARRAADRKGWHEAVARVRSDAV